MSRGDLLVDEVDILDHDVFGDLGSQMDEIYVRAHFVECFDPVVVFEVAVHGGLTVTALSGYLGRVFSLEDDLANDGGFVGYAGAHVMEGAGMRQRAVVLGFVLFSYLGDLSWVSKGQKAQVSGREDTALGVGLSDHPGNGLLDEL